MMAGIDDPGQRWLLSCTCCSPRATPCVPHPSPSRHETDKSKAVVGMAWTSKAKRSTTRQQGRTTTAQDHPGNNTGTSTAQQQQRHDQQTNTQQQHQTARRNTENINENESDSVTASGSKECKTSRSLAPGGNERHQSTHATCQTRASARCPSARARKHTHCSGPL